MLLSSGQKLTLYELNKEDGGRQVKINKFIRNNGKTLFNVYSAVSKRNQGFLYEFFDDSLLERGKTGKLVLSDKSLKSDFIEYRTEITSDIETLRGLNILPEITILYANPVNDENINKKACSFYIWVPFDATSNVTDYIAEGNDKKTIVFPEHKLDGIILTAISLTKIMSRINASGFRFDSLSTDDIFIRHEKKAKIDKESINPVCLDLIVSASPDIAFLGDSDLLGRILFRMITGKEYESSFFGTIHKEISEAPLIMSSYRSSSVYVVNRVYDIIRKLVSEEYSDYSQILSDLYTLKDNFLYEKTNHDVGTIRALDSAKTTAETKTDSTIVIQNMLDSRPLYCCSPQKITNLHILAVGCGNYGQEFINQSLQHGQMDGVNLRITAVSNNPDTDKENYLSNKPALKKFVSINGEKINDPFAELNFEPISENGSSFSLINKSENERLVKDLVNRHKDVSYIFVALGNEKLNKDIAELFAEIAGNFNNGCCVNYACQSESYKYEKAYPVCINSRSSKKIGKDLRDMALKVHLSWSKATDRPLDVIREEFESKPYEFSSSLCNAINIRYKLRSLGIEYDFKNRESLYNAAEEFNRTVLLNSDKTNFNRLVWLEHRRWVLEKAVSSWDELPAKDYEKIIALRATKDNNNCKHPCLVRSNPSSPDIWKTDASRLDPLDRMSVNFNAALKKAAEESKRNWPEQEDLIAFAGKRIKEFHIDGKKKSLAQYAYNRYVVAIKNILSESTVYAKRYTSYYNNLLSACEDLGGKEFKAEISSLLKQVDTAMFPIVESAKKADYKAIDAFLVTKIPYILTVPLSPNIAMCFSAKYGNAETLSNITANLALSTNKIYYFYYYDSDSNVSFLTRKIRLVKNYLKEKKIYCKLNFFIAVAPGCEPVRTVLEENLKSIDGIEYQVKSCNDAYNAHEQFRDYLSDKKISFYNRSVNLYNNYRLDDHLVRTLGYPWFEFSLEDNSIYAPTCSYLEYPDTSGIHIATEDLLLLSNAKDSSFHFSELFDFAKDIWENIFSNPDYFKSNVDNWNSLCQLISKHFLKHDAWATIEINGESVIANDKSEIKECSYTLPATCFKTAKKITDALAKEKLISDHVVKSKLSGVCEISFKAKKKVSDELKNVFEKQSPDTLSNSKIIETEIVYEDNANKKFVVFFNSLHVTDLDLTYLDKNNGEKKLNNDYHYILKTLKKGGFIKNLAVNGPDNNKGYKANFDFSTHSVKNIMKKEGELLENYIFYEAVSTGYFDDVVGGFEFFYEQAGSNEPVKNEVDCLLTKDSKTIVVEAKARFSIDQDVIHKLCNVASNIGVNAKKVLVITNHSKSEHIRKTTETQFARGDKDEVIIISGREEIANIGETLVKIAKGTYIPPKGYFDI